MPRKTAILVISFLSVFFNFGAAIAQTDGYSPQHRLVTTYFTISYDSEQDLARFNRNIYIPASQKILYGMQAGINNTDMLFLWVSDILGMHLSNFPGNIKICSSKDQLRQIYNKLFKQSLSAPSFYVYKFKTIYIDVNRASTAVLGHEMAHAIISDYFSAVPPVKMQEILAGYVEYQIRKDSQ